uniref:Uncharacterized protein n=1 Tax=Timema cristinae TaxID=61476 RepID=A0A7R9CPM5_TIMCR|nr:unnamed protein product [Timema cristinae]
MLAQEMNHFESSLQSRDQGKFAVCASHHVYHLNCAMMVLGSFACLHCGQDPLDRFMVIDVHAGKSPIFFPHPQVPKKRPSAKMCFGGSHTIHTKPEEVPLTESIALISESVTEMPETFSTDLDKEKLANFLSVASSMLTNPVPAHSPSAKMCFGGSHTIHTKPEEVPLTESIALISESVTEMPETFSTDLDKEKLANFLSVASSMLTNPVPAHSRPLYHSSTLAQTAPTTLSTAWTAPHFMFSKPSVTSSPLYSAPMGIPLSIVSLGGHHRSHPPPTTLSLDSNLHPVLSLQPSSPSLTMPSNRSSPSSQSPTPSLDPHNFHSPSFILTFFQPYDFLYPF